MVHSSPVGFFNLMCLYLSIALLTTALNHPKTNGKTERYDKTIAARLRHYVKEHQDDWDAFSQPLTYPEHSQVHRSMNTTSSCLAMRGELTSPDNTSFTPAMTSAANMPVLARLLKQSLKLVQTQTSSSIEMAQKQYRKHLDKSFCFQSKYI